MLRATTTDPSGNEITAFFRWQKEFGADPNTYFKKNGARYTWIALENTEILELNQDKIEQMSRRNAGFLKLRIRMQRRLMERLTERVESFIFLTPEERFEQMLTEFPDLCERVPDKYLASFLGITPVSLSRIKKRILN